MLTARVAKLPRRLSLVFIECCAPFGWVTIIRERRYNGSSAPQPISLTISYGTEFVAWRKTHLVVRANFLADQKGLKSRFTAHPSTIPHRRPEKSSGRLADLGLARASRPICTNGDESRLCQPFKAPFASSLEYPLMSTGRWASALQEKRAWTQLEPRNGVQNPHRVLWPGWLE